MLIIISMLLTSLISHQANAGLIKNPYGSFSEVAEDIQAHLSPVGGLNIRYLEQFYGVPKIINDERDFSMNIEGCNTQLITNEFNAIVAFSVPTSTRCRFNLISSDDQFYTHFSDLTFKDVLSRYAYSEDGRTSYTSTPCINCGNAFEPFTTYHYTSPHVLNFMQIEFEITQPSYFEFWDKEDSVDEITLDKHVLKVGLDERVNTIKVGYNLFAFREYDN